MVAAADAPGMLAGQIAVFGRANSSSIRCLVVAEKIDWKVGASF